MSSNKYWENETPITTTTEFAEVHYYKEAGKIQLYPTYTDKDGEKKLGRGCTWDNNEMDSDDALKLVFAVMRGLLDCGVENDAYNDAYDIIKNAVNDLDDSDEDDLDEFEDEETPFDKLEDLDFDEVKQIAKILKFKVRKSHDLETLVDDLLENFDSDELLDAINSLAPTEDEEVSLTKPVVKKKFGGEHLVFDGNKISVKNKKKDSDYYDWATEAVEYAEYIEHSRNIASGIKHNEEKKKHIKKVEKELNKWLKEWDEDTSEKFKPIFLALLNGKKQLLDARIEIIAILDAC